VRPVIIGMNNPISLDSHYALYPHPPGCAGHRLWKMLEVETGATMLQYLRAFDRRNLLPTREWTGPRDARAAAEAMVPTLVDRHVLLLGAEVRRAFDLADLLPGTSVDLITDDGRRFYYLPHPSGRNLWYNDEANRQLAARVLAGLYELSTGKTRNAE